jgi:hypothetical protein
MMVDIIAEQRAELARLRELLVEIDELVDNYVDITGTGNPNWAMQIASLVQQALRGVDKQRAAE